MKPESNIGKEAEGQRSGRAPDVAYEKSEARTATVDVTKIPLAQIGESYQLENAIKEVMAKYKAVDVEIDYSTGTVTVKPGIIFNIALDDITIRSARNKVHISAEGPSIMTQLIHLVLAFSLNRTVGFYSFANAAKDADQVVLILSKVKQE